MTLAGHRFLHRLLTKPHTTTTTAPHRSLVTLALTRTIPASFLKALRESNDHDPINLAKAHQEHQSYVNTLRQSVPTLSLPPLDDHPDSVFVEDAVITRGIFAVQTRPGHPSRRGEVESIGAVLRDQLGMEVMEMNDDATCDGGDILSTGRHVFCGISERTSEQTVPILEEGLKLYRDGIQVVPVPVQGALHLKSLVTHIDANTLVAPKGELGDAILESMQALDLGYQTVRLPSALACNVVVVNGVIIAQDGGCSESRALLTKAGNERNMKVVFLEASEVAKVDGALTCCSVLLEL